MTLARTLASESSASLAIAASAPGAGLAFIAITAEGMLLPVLPERASEHWRAVAPDLAGRRAFVLTGAADTVRAGFDVLGLRYRFDDVHVYFDSALVGPDEATAALAIAPVGMIASALRCAEHPHPAIRAAALDRIADLLESPPIDDDILAAQLTDGHPGVRRAAVRVTARTGRPEVFTAHATTSASARGDSTTTLPFQ